MRRNQFNRQKRRPNLLSFFYTLAHHVFQKKRQVYSSVFDSVGCQFVLIEILYVFEKRKPAPDGPYLSTVTWYRLSTKIQRFFFAQQIHLYLRVSYSITPSIAIVS